MYLEHKETGEVKTLKLSEAIRKGAPMVEETRTWSGCALATAAVGFGFQHSGEFTGVHPSECWGFLAKRGFDSHLLSAINTLHCNGMPRMQIASWLEARGL